MNNGEKASSATENEPARGSVDEALAAALSAGVSTSNPRSAGETASPASTTPASTTPASTTPASVYAAPVQSLDVSGSSVSHPAHEKVDLQKNNSVSVSSEGSSRDVMDETFPKVLAEVSVSGESPSFSTKARSRFSFVRSDIRDRRALRRHLRRSRPGWLPRTFYGAAALLLAFAFGSGVTSAVLYARFDYKVEDSLRQVRSEMENLGVVTPPTETQDVETGNDTPLGPGAGVPVVGASGILDRLSDSVFELAITTPDVRSLVPQETETVPEEAPEVIETSGIVSLATAFPVAAAADQTYFLTSLEAIRPLIATQGAAGVIRSQTGEFEVSVWTWDENSGIALLSANITGVSALPWGASQAAISNRQPLYLAGSSSGVPSRYLINAVDDTNIYLEPSTTVSALDTGAPVIDSSGSVVAIVTSGGDTPSEAVQLTRITVSCDAVLECN